MNNPAMNNPATTECSAKDVTFEEYCNLVRDFINLRPESSDEYILVVTPESIALSGRLSDIETEHPEYEDMLCDVKY